MSLSDDQLQQIEEVATIARDASRILFITGAGISADSGLPTYRGVGGLYRDRSTVDGLPIEEALSGDVFYSRPDITWKYLIEIEKACRNAEPNRAHKIIAEWETDRPGVWVFTQNVDGLHRLAGSQNVIDIHGDVHSLRCTHCDWEERVADYSHLEPVPRCPSCGSPIRPDVVLFGELLPMDKISRLHHERQLGFDMIFSIGTSSLFPYIIEPVFNARVQGIPTIEINPEETEISGIVDFHIQARAAETMAEIAKRT